MAHPVSLPEGVRFWQRVDRRGSDECWPWLGYLYKNGYAGFNRRQEGATYRKVMAHRVAYELTHGTPVPADMTIDHLCHNRSCMNPAHMEVVTRGENARRGEGWKVSAVIRMAKAAGACIHGHDRSKYGRREPSTGAWRCRECRRIEAARRRREARG